MREVGDVACQAPGIECLQHRLDVDDLVAREIQQAGALAKTGAAFGVDQVARRLEHRKVQADEIGAREKRTEIFHPAHFARQSPRGLHRQRRIETDHFHAEAEAESRHLAADGAETHDAERLAAQFVTREALLLLL
jgi:hypothetical protein